MVILLITSGVCKFDLYLDKNNSEKKISAKDISLFLFFIIFSTVMSIRSVDVGIDTASYTRIYTKIAVQDSLQNAFATSTISSPTYILICRLLSYISKNPYIMIVFSSIFVNFFLVMYIKRASKNYLLSIFCWIGLALFYFSMNGCRQAMSIVLVLYATYLICDSDYKSIKGWFIFIIAILTHYSAAFVLIGLGLSIINNKIKDKWSTFLLTTIITGGISVIYLEAFKYIAKVIPKYSQYITGKTEYSIYGANANGRIVILYLFLLAIMIIGIYVTTRKDSTNDKIDKYHVRIIPIIIFGIIFGIANYKNKIISRLLLFYISFYISFIPYVSSKLKGNFRLLFNIGIIFVLSVYSILSLIENQNGVIPYTTFFYK